MAATVMLRVASTAGTPLLTTLQDIPSSEIILRHYVMSSRRDEPRQLAVDEGTQRLHAPTAVMSYEAAHARKYRP